MIVQAKPLPPPKRKPIPAAAEKHRSYLKDASHFKGKAKRIFFPSDESQISWLLKKANQTGIPLTLSGAGTGLTGARVPLGGDILSMERMNKILKIRRGNAGQEGYALLQAGVRLCDLERALEERGLFYPPNPGEKTAFLGGTVATNASGSRSFRYGATRRWVKGFRLLLPNGDLLSLTRGQVKAKQGIFTIALSNGKKVTLEIPRCPKGPPKNCAGYYARPGMDLVDLFIGSEGTLGVFTEVTLRILKQPEGLLSGFLFFPSEKSCFRFAQEAKKLKPRALEFFDSHSLRLLSRKHPNLPSKASAALFFEAETPGGKGPQAQEKWVKRLRKFKALPSWFSSRPDGEPYFREIRHDLPVEVNQLLARGGFQKVGTDLAVPPEAAKAMFDFYLKELKRCRFPYVLFGHLGDNHLHANLLPRTQKEFERSKRIYRLLAERALALGGTVSAEHGIGKTRIPYLRMMVGEEGLRRMRRVKQALDPNGILSPGNIIPLP